MTDWQISESGATVAVDANGHGTVTFTVTNPGPDHDRAVLRVAPDDDTERDWFRVEEPQRAVGPGDSAVWVVELEIPEGTREGTYGFQGVVYSADRDPGESSATSRRVTFDVARQEEKAAFPWWVVGVVAVVVVVIALSAWWLSRDDVELAEVPLVVGLKQSAARDILDDRFEVVGDPVPGRPVPDDCDPPVDSQSPAAGTMLEVGGEVTISYALVTVFDRIECFGLSGRDFEIPRQLEEELLALDLGAAGPDASIDR